MKVRNIKTKKEIKNKTKLIKLKLLKTQTYIKKNHLSNIKIEDIVCRLKKGLHIIYKYHINNKRILFIGSPLSTYDEIKQLLKNTKHILIPESVWMNGIITNKSSFLQCLSKNTNNKKISELLFQFKKRSDLIVILKQSTNISALNEIYNTRIPVIVLNSNLNILNPKSTYKIPGNFSFTEKKTRHHFFYSILNTTLKKAKKDKIIDKKLNIKKHQFLSTTLLNIIKGNVSK